VSHLERDLELVRGTRNTARFFTETRHVAWVLLFFTVAWGVYGYRAMPQRKDPDIPVRDALVLCAWPGAGAEQVEQLVTRRIEAKIGENSKVERLTSSTRSGLSVVSIRLQKGLTDVGKQFDDIKLKLDTLRDLPQGAGPVQFVKDFGDTATLMLTLASPRSGAVEVALRTRALRAAIERARQGAAPGTRVAIVYGFPSSLTPTLVRPQFEQFGHYAEQRGALADVQFFEGAGFVGLDARSNWADAQLAGLGEAFLREHLRASELHPDAWRPLAVRDLGDLERRLAAAAGDRYSYRELEDYGDLVQRTLQAVPLVAKVEVKGVLPERIHLHYSQERLASYGLRPAGMSEWLGARNITAAGGVLEIGAKNMRIDPSGEFHNEREIGDVLVPVGAGHGALYLRDVVNVVREYESPPRFLNFFTRRAPDGSWPRTRAITLSVQMRAGEQIERFGQAVDAALADVAQRLPEDLILARTSDQPLQVEEAIALFMRSLDEAVILVVLVSLIGFWEWRSALLMALSIPLTLALTFGLTHALGIDLQQVSIASLIIALGLLVDDPVVAGDAIKRALADGHTPLVAAWLGPTKLATAILYATLTNIVAYLPFLMLTGETGKFIYSLPVVVTCSLVASRLVSMTFIPLLGYYLLRPRPEASVAERRTRGFAAWYYHAGQWAIARRFYVLAASLLLLVAGGAIFTQLRTQFFPKDLSYMFYVDVWLPEDAPLLATNRATAETEAVVRAALERYGREHPGPDGQPRQVLESLTSFVGGGAPRFWISVTPEQQQINYAQVLVQVRDKHDTRHLIAPVQQALAERVLGANVDVRQLETGAPVGIPVSLRISGEHIPTLRRLASEAREILRSHPGAQRVRDDWGAESFAVRLQIDADKANLAGVTNLDVATASATAMNGQRVATLREGHKQIPVLARLRMNERAQLGDVQNLYVYAAQGMQKVPLGAVSRVDYGLETQRLQRRNQFRTVTVSAFPAEGLLSSQVLKPLRPRIDAFARSLPPGYKLEIGGEYEKQVEGFRELALVMAVSVLAIFLALVIQFQHAIKPLLVFAAIPYGIVGAVAALWVMGAPFGFMAFLGVASLVGVIVSHVIVLFDFIEEQRAEGAPLVQALLDAGIMRLRPVLITVGATVIALVPLAQHGGPLWEPLCYAQIGGLSMATVVTLLLVPVLYAIFVLDLKIVRWERQEEQA
jgi:multidrug efflux pump subunit AcrB